MQKHLIRVHGKDKTGKTQAIATFFNNYLEGYTPANVTISGYKEMPIKPKRIGKRYEDFACTLEIKGAEIGICSYGDPERKSKVNKGDEKQKKLYQILHYFMKVKKCKLIIGASRSTPQPCKIYENLKEEYHCYEEDTIPTIECPNDDKEQKKDHERIAKEIYEKAKGWSIL